MWKYVDSQDYSFNSNLVFLVSTEQRNIIKFLEEGFFWVMREEYKKFHPWLHTKSSLMPLIGLVSTQSLELALPLLRIANSDNLMPVRFKTLKTAYLWNILPLQNIIK